MQANKKIHKFMHNVPAPSAHKHDRHHFTSIRAASCFAVIQTILGIACILFTEQIHNIFPIVLGLLMVAVGILDIYRGVATKEYHRADTKLTSQGIVVLILGSVILHHYQNADQIIGAIWGVIGLIKGSEMLNVAIYRCATKLPFAWKLVHSVIELLLGILLLLDPLTAVEHHLPILGIELIAIGVHSVIETKKATVSESTISRDIIYSENRKN